MSWLNWKPGGSPATEKIPGGNGLPLSPENQENPVREGFPGFQGASADRFSNKELAGGRSQLDWNQSENPSAQKISHGNRLPVDQGNLENLATGKTGGGNGLLADPENHENPVIKENPSGDRLSPNPENPPTVETVGGNGLVAHPENPGNPLLEENRGGNGLPPHPENPENPAEGADDADRHEQQSSVGPDCFPRLGTVVNQVVDVAETTTGPSAQVEVGPAPVTFRLITDQEEAARVLGELSGSDLVGLDTETTGLDPIRDRIRLLQIAHWHGEPVIIIDCARIPLEGLRELIGALRVAGHNMVFDCRMLAAANVRFQQPPECTLLLNHALTGKMEDLKTLAARRLGIELPKEHQLANWAGELSEGMLSYAARDAATTLALAHDLRAEVEKHGALQVYRLMRGAQAAVVEMELAGIGFDADQHRLLLLDAGRKQSAALWELRRCGLDEPNSAKATAKWLERFGPSTSWPRTKPGQLCTDAATLRYRAHSLSAEGRQAVEKLLQFRDSSKLLSTYGSKFAGYVHPDTGRIHAQFLLAGTRTGRMSCRSPNLQQIPRDPAFRDCFRAPEGRCLVVADYSQIELRVAAIVAREPGLLEAYQKGVDVHRETAARLLKKCPEDVTKPERQLAKAVNFGLLYGQGARGLARYAAAEFDVHLTESEARKYRRIWFDSFPCLRTWQERQAEERRRLGQVTTPAGRVRHLDHDLSPALAALNTPISGGAAEVMLAALGNLPAALMGIDAVPVLVVHDELVLEVAGEEAEEAARRLETLMFESFLEIFPGGSTQGLVEAGIGATWAEAKK